MRITDLYASVTQSIIRELETGAAPWLKPWRNGRTSGLMPQNYVTGRPYSGINIMLLWSARDAAGYADNGWMTFNQAREKGACVRKGQKATAVVFTKKLTVKDRENEDEEKRINMLRIYYVFNQAQIDGLPARKPEPPAPILLPIDAADSLHRGDEGGYPDRRQQGLLRFRSRLRRDAGTPPLQIATGLLRDELA